jgi:hypothetical protein
MSFRHMISRVGLTLGLVALAAATAVAAPPKLDKRVIPVGSEPGVTLAGETVKLTASAVVNFSTLAEMEKLGLTKGISPRVRRMEEENEREIDESGGEEPGRG